MSRLKFVTVIMALGVICAPGASLCTHTMPEAMSCESNQTEMLAVKVSEYGADRLAGHCAAGDISLFISYQKTLNYIIEFAIEHGITGAYNRKFAYAGSGYDRGFNLKKPETVQYRTVNPNGAKKTDGKTKDQRTATHKERKIDTQLDLQRKVGNVGTFRDLTDGKPFHDGKQAHHLPSQRYLEHHGLDTDDGLAIMLTKEQHIKTRSYGRKAQNIDLNASYRSELGCDLWDVMRILKADGSWTPEVRRSILSGLDNFKKEYPKLFEKVNK